MKSFLQFNEDAESAHRSMTSGLGQSRSGTIGGSYNKPSVRPKTGIGGFLKDKINQMRKPELRSQQKKASSLTKKPDTSVQKVNVSVQDRGKERPAYRPRLTPAEKQKVSAAKQKRLSSSAKRKALVPIPQQKALPPSPQQKELPPSSKQKELPPSPQQKALPPSSKQKALPPARS